MLKLPETHLLSASFLHGFYVDLITVEKSGLFCCLREIHTFDAINGSKIRKRFRSNFVKQQSTDGKQFTIFWRNCVDTDEGVCFGRITFKQIHVSLPLSFCAIPA